MPPNSDASFMAKLLSWSEMLSNEAYLKSKEAASSSAILRTFSEVCVILLNATFLLVIRIFPPLPGGRKSSTVWHAHLPHHISQASWLPQKSIGEQI